MISELLFAGATPQYAGLDHISLHLPRTLARRGEVEVRVAVESKVANTVKLWIK